MDRHLPVAVPGEVSVQSLIRSRATTVWAVLTLLTVVSWALGTGHGLGGGNHVPASLAIFVVAVFKARLIGLYFMELRAATGYLRGIFEGWCVVLLGLLTGLYLLA
ncbi:MAG: cytochrome C oxidase subunit IV family protein [Mycobacterium sp.]